MLQSDLQYLLSQGWKLVGLNLIQSPDGSVQTEDIAKAAKSWRIKMEIREKLLKKGVDSSRNLK